MKILVINGPNINLLGTRQVEIYGTAGYKDLVKSVKKHCKAKGVKVKFFQSNCEGKIVTAIQKAAKKFGGIVINPAAYTHTSVAIADAVAAVNIKTVEVHISSPDEREDFRKISYIRPYCVAVVKGSGLEGYNKAIDILSE